MEDTQEPVAKKPKLKPAITYLQIVLALVFLGGMIYFMVKQPALEPFVPPELCRQYNPIPFERKIIERTENDWKRIYVNDRWNTLITDVRDEFGYYLALCRSRNQWVEIFDARTEKKIARYKIDMEYKLKHGLPMER